MTERITQFGPWTFDAIDAALTHNSGFTRSIEPRAAAILWMLIEREGGIVTKDEMADALWGGVVSDEAMVATIARLRRHLDDSASNSSYIQTIPKVGYRLVAPTTPIGAVKKRGMWPVWLAAAALVAALGWSTLPLQDRGSPDVVRARALLERGTRDGTHAAETLLLRTIREEPSDTAVATLAELYAGKHARLLGLTHRAALARSADALTLAERRGADLSSTAVARGELELQLNLDPKTALAYAAKARPTEGQAHLTVRALAAMGELERAATVAARATRQFPTSDRLQWDLVLVAYLQGDPTHSVAVLRQAEVAGTSRRDWLAALIWLQAGDRHRARHHWLRFYSGRAPAAHLAIYRDATPTSFAQFVASLDRAGAATCADRAFAAAEIGDGRGVRSSVDRCRAERHPLAPLLHRYPLLRASG